MCNIANMTHNETAPALDHEDVRRMVAKWAVDCGRRVQERRQLFSWDRRTLSELVGVSEPTMIRIEQGSINPRDYLKLSIAACLLCEVEDLWPYPRRTDVFGAASIEGTAA